ncbi:acetoin dehydrogenase dihydrolipoyllysine-residue acetyltransferase subunit [Enterovibrio norvegicus]|uniref:Pyruvate dehydrogenase E2 component (Dihydrolipoamide acetyltransferase) n=1 Tax=Enterovibrio norvegicus DSM 15893 TaxID=1121869 RepID=A0A1I5ULS9_9GAMM|nr:acetoin dehydrogenase dihydrolipoyllysine-residue acetyltransferase subunit [Enterovibrio norvegicus]SFP96291.1 pyruvate dehydrogenase E2 component (dihydrolipoamide acetyltransferase) [Enterovibrio norvegicus DSM 15893]
MNERIIPVVMPKWGLSMKEGTLTEWHVKEGDTIEVGQIIMDVETDKIASEVEAPDAGLLRRCIGQEGDVYGVQALLGVLAPDDVSDQDIASFIASYQEPATDEGNDDEKQTAYQYLDTNAGKIRYSYRQGEGKPFVLIHGFGGDLDNWLFNIDTLNEKGPVLVLDLPGHGQSTASTEALTLELLSQSVVDVVAANDIRNAHFVGHSMGGLICGHLALTHPDIVQSLSLIASAGLGTDINAHYINGFVSAQNRRELKPILQLLFADPALVTRNLVDDVLKYKRLDGINHLLDGLSAHLFKETQQRSVISTQLDQLSIPILTLWGEHDLVIPSQHAESVTTANVHVFSAAGHMVQMEAASDVNAAILTHTQ